MIRRDNRSANAIHRPSARGRVRTFCAYATVVWAASLAAQSANRPAAQPAPSTDPQMLLSEAASAHQHGDAAAEAREYGQLLREHPEAAPRVEALGKQTASAVAFLLAGQTRLAVSQFDLAGRDAESARILNPKLPGLATLTGMILEQTADYDGAERSLQQALAENPNDYNAHFYLGAIFYFKRDMAPAREHLQRALQLDPTAVQARYELALVERADGNPAAAAKELETVVRQLPDWLQPHVELSALYYRLHRPEDGAREKQIVDRMMAALQQRQAQSAK